MSDTETRDISLLLHQHQFDPCAGYCVSDDGDGQHCVHWWDCEPCCWCGHPGGDEDGCNCDRHQRLPDSEGDKVTRDTEHDPVKAMQQAVMALALEVPEPVWLDVIDRWNAVVAEMEALRGDPEGIPVPDPD